MSNPAEPPRPRAPIGVPLAIMVFACALIVLALILVAQGAVAHERARASGRAATADFLRSEIVGVALNTVAADGGAALPPAAGAPASRQEAAPAPIVGRFVLGRTPSPDETALSDRIAESRSGGGVVVGDEVHVLVQPDPSVSVLLRR